MAGSDSSSDTPFNCVSMVRQEFFLGAQTNAGENIRTSTVRPTLRLAQILRLISLIGSFASWLLIRFEIWSWTGHESSPDTRIATNSGQNFTAILSGTFETSILVRIELESLKFTFDWAVRKRQMNPHRPSTKSRGSQHSLASATTLKKIEVFSTVCHTCGWLHHLMDFKVPKFWCQTNKWEREEERRNLWKTGSTRARRSLYSLYL